MVCLWHLLRWVWAISLLLLEQAPTPPLALAPARSMAAGLVVLVLMEDGALERLAPSQGHLLRRPMVVMVEVTRLRPQVLVTRLPRLSSVDAMTVLLGSARRRRRSLQVLPSSEEVRQARTTAPPRPVTRLHRRRLHDITRPPHRQLTHPLRRITRRLVRVTVRRLLICMRVLNPPRTRPSPRVTHLLRRITHRPVPPIELQVHSSLQRVPSIHQP